MTDFKQVANNAISHAASGSLNNTTDPVTFSVDTGEGNDFPQPGNGFWVTFFDDSQYADPKDDPNMEIGLCTSRTSDSFTVTRGQLGTSNVAHPGTPAVSLLLVDQLLKDIYTAINYLERKQSAEKTSSQTGISTEVDITGLSVTIDVPSNRKVLILGYLPNLTFSASGAGGKIRLKRGTTTLTYGTVHQQSGVPLGCTVMTVDSPSSGNQTYKLTAERAFGSGTMDITASSTLVAFILARIL